MLTIIPNPKAMDYDKLIEEQLEQDFPDFYQQMKDFLHQSMDTTRLAWYLT